MTTQTEGSVYELLAFDTSDRMRKAIQVRDLSIAEMAEYLDVSRQGVGTWLGGRRRPSTQTLRLWALRTGVPYEWLTTGECPGQDSNLQPTGWVDAQVIAFPSVRLALAA